MVLRKNKKAGRRISVTPAPSDSVLSTVSANESESKTAFSTATTDATDSINLNTTSSSADGTLDMISTPWSTESSLSVSSYLSWSNSEVLYSSLSLGPKTSTSYGILSPDLKSSKTMLTLLSSWSYSLDSDSIKPLVKNITTRSNTLSSWTMESFTSAGLLTDYDSNIVKVKYPWSPNTVFSGTDFYPSTVDSLVSRKGSRETVATSLSGKDDISPMNYISLSKKYDNQVFDWILVKQKGIPICWDYYNKTESRV